MRISSALMFAMLAACTIGDQDIVGPFSGPVTRFVIDRITLPTDNSSALALGDDLTGNGMVDNQLGMVFGVLATYGDLNVHAGDIIASGAIASSLELQAEDLENAARAGATYVGADGDPATVAGGRIVDGVFTSNLTRTTNVPGAAIIALPVFADADPSSVELHAMEIDLTPDGSGGYDAVVRGGVPYQSLLDETAAGLFQMVENDPVDHALLLRQLGVSPTSPLTADEVETALGSSSLFGALIAPDVTLFGEQDTSLGFAVHVVPCPSGDCARGIPADTCADRVQDGDETDVDCGGSCQPCQGGSACNVDGDCATQACDGGVCRAPSCSDGIRDGFESDVDCGWNCPACATGKVCYSDSDCASGACSVFGGGSCL
jgi:hypothetical protein